MMADYYISTDKSKLDLDSIHGFLVKCYWAKGIPKETVAKSIEHSDCFGVYKDTQQVGFARVISDYATFMYIADVYILPEHRGQGLGVELICQIVNHSEYQGIRTWTLLTADAHGLYEKFDFYNLDEPKKFMSRRVKYPYEIEEIR